MGKTDHSSWQTLQTGPIYPLQSDTCLQVSGQMLACGSRLHFSQSSDKKREEEGKQEVEEVKNMKKVTFPQLLHLKLQLFTKMEDPAFVWIVVYLCHLPLLRFCRSYFQPTYIPLLLGYQNWTNNSLQPAKRRESKQTNAWRKHHPLEVMLWPHTPTD